MNRHTDQAFSRARRTLSLFALVTLVLGATAALAAAPEVGAPAPPFEFQGVDGVVYSSADLYGEQGVVVAWFPKAFTPGWTTELAALRDSAEKIAEFDVKVLYVSLDTPEKNAEFAASLQAELPVVSDPDGRAAKSFGVLGMGGLYSRRWTFYIDADGILREIDQKVSPSTAGADMVEKLEALGFAKRGTVAQPKASLTKAPRTKAPGTKAPGTKAP